MKTSALIENGEQLILKTDTNQYSITKKDVINPLGKGQFGTVYSATNYNTKAKCAVKQISKTTPTINMLVKREIKIMKDACHYKDSANLVYAIDSVEDSNHFYVVMPSFDKGNLSHFINEIGILSETEAIEYFRQICYGLRILHNYGNIHRDLKSDNILVNSYYDPCYKYHYYFAVGDFGVSKKCESSSMLQSKCVGTAYTMAPEVCDGFYDQRADIFSIGCILYKMLTKKEPFNAMTAEGIKILKEKPYISVKSIWNTPLSKLTMEILEGCLQVDYENRMTPNELYERLDVCNLYTQYNVLKLGDSDPDANINLNVFNRKKAVVSTKTLSICKCTSISVVSPEKKESIIFREINSKKLDFDAINNLIKSKYYIKQKFNPTQSMASYCSNMYIPIIINKNEQDLLIIEKIVLNCLKSDMNSAGETLEGIFETETDKSMKIIFSYQTPKPEIIGRHLFMSITGKEFSETTKNYKVITHNIKIYDILFEIIEKCLAHKEPLLDENYLDQMLMLYIKEESNRQEKTYIFNN